jgi:hypothetical protein
MKIARLEIEQTWTCLLEQLGEAQVIATREGATEIGARLATLQTALRSLGTCWKEITGKLPANHDAEELPAPVGTTPQRAYYKPLARALAALGGHAAAREAIRRTAEIMGSQLTPQDREPTETGRIRWDTNVRFARQELRERGLILPSIGDGCWELTDAGRRWAESSDLNLPSPVPLPVPGQQELFT